jgi:hypothetical protein
MITKHRNQLKGDIVEALQCLKCAIRHDLLFKEPGSSSATKDFEIDNQSEGTADNKLCLDLFDNEEGPGWGDRLLDTDEDNFNSDFVN